MSTVINNNFASVVNMVDCRPHGDCEININDNLADDSRKIFVGGLSWETSEDDLRKYFSEFGIVKSCIIKLDRYTNHSRGFGFVIFDSEETVNKVLEIKEHILNKKKIDPKKAKPSREPQKKVFVGGLDPDLSESMIKDYFSQFGEFQEEYTVEDVVYNIDDGQVDYNYDKSNKSHVSMHYFRLRLKRLRIENIETPFDTRKNKRKAYLFITFSNESEARKAASQECQEISGKKFEVRIAIPREQANRSKGWKGTNNNMFYPYTMLPYMYPDYFYPYLYNNPSLYNSYYNPYELLNYDPVTLSRQFSTGVMINNSSSSSTAPRPKIPGNANNNNISTKSNPFINNIDNNSSSSSHSVNAPLQNGNVFMSHSSSSSVQRTTTTTSNNQNFTKSNNNDNASSSSTSVNANMFESNK